jgi:hypothetical protein
MDSSGSGKVAVAYQYPYKNALLAKPEVFFFIWNGLLDGGFRVIIAQKLNIKLAVICITVDVQELNIHKYIKCAQFEQSEV